MAPRGLSDLAHSAWLRARGRAPDSLSARERAAIVAVETWGVRALDPSVPLINVAALADAARARLVVHQLRAQTAELIDATDLRTLPSEPPALLRGPWIVEPADLVRPLAGGVIGVGGYEIDGRTYVVTLTSDGAAQSGELTLHWGSDDGPTIDDHGAGELGLLGLTREQWAQPLCQGLRTALLLGLLLDAERSPIGSSDAHPRARKGAARDERRAAEAWTVRTCGVRPSAVRGAPAGAGAPIDGAYRLAVETPVRGHLKRQPHGPKGGERKFVWVESYEARRWVAPASRVRV